MLEVDTIRSHLGGLKPTEGSTEILPELAEAAQAIFEGMVGFSLSSSSRTKYFDVDQPCETELWLAEVPASITSVKERDSVQGTYTTVDAADYEQVGTNLTRTNGYWARGKRSVEVVYVAGYADESELPADIKLALLEIVGTIYRNRVTARPPVQFEGDSLVTTTNRFPSTVWAAVHNHRRIYFG